MDGEKETAEEKEEEEEKGLHHIAAASSVDYSSLPIMHWEDLSQRIAELEKQEQERRERSKVSHADKRVGISWISWGSVIPASLAVQWYYSPKKTTFPMRRGVLSP